MVRSKRLDERNGKALQRIIPEHKTHIAINRYSERSISPRLRCARTNAFESSDALPVMQVYGVLLYLKSSAVVKSLEAFPPAPDANVYCGDC